MADLLEELAKELKLAYLSDLRLMEHRTRLKKAVEHLQGSFYSSKQWNKMIAYLADPSDPPPQQFDNSKDALDYLLKKLS